MPLMTNLVTSGTQQGTVVVLRYWCVIDYAGSTTTYYVFLLYVKAVSRTVECPLKVNVLGVGVNLTSDVRPLLLSHAVDSGLVRPASWCICRGRVSVNL